MGAESGAQGRAAYGLPVFFVEGWASRIYTDAERSEQARMADLPPSALERR